MSWFNADLPDAISLAWRAADRLLMRAFGSVMVVYSMKQGDRIRVLCKKIFMVRFLSFAYTERGTERGQKHLSTMALQPELTAAGAPEL